MSTKPTWHVKGRKTFLCYLFLTCICVSVPGAVARVAERGQLAGVNSLPPRESRGSSSGYQVAGTFPP